MIEGIRQDMKQLVTNLKTGDWDTYWMVAIVALSLYGIYVIYSMPC